MLSVNEWVIFITKEASMINGILSVLLIGFSSLLQAAHPYINHHEEGWYWHNEPEETKAVKKAKPIPSNVTTRKPVADPDKTWKLIGKVAARARAKAILNPTPTNIANARRLQRLIVAQANVFSERWMLDLLLHPEQDESLVNPSNNSARDIYNQQNGLIKEKTIEQLSQTAGLVYFYEGGEPFSERMAEVVSEFAARYQMPLIPIAMGKRISPIFPQSRLDSGDAEQLGVKHIPALFALNSRSKKSMPLAYGLVSQSELKENILMASRFFQSGDSHAN